MLKTENPYPLDFLFFQHRKIALRQVGYGLVVLIERHHIHRHQARRDSQHWY